MALSGRLAKLARALQERHGGAEEHDLDDPFALVLWEQVAYLAGDGRRRAAFAALVERVGLSSQAVLAADRAVLVEIAVLGGSIGVDTRAQRMHDSARRVADRWGGDLRGVLALPVEEAIRELTRFPMIGRPGAEKILLLTRTRPLLALDSNGLRVLLRVGYGEEGGRYEQSYRSVREAVAADCGSDCDPLVRLHGHLRRHGQEVCRRKRPLCEACPLTVRCAYFAARSDS